MNFFIKKPSQLFNLEDKNTSLQAKITQDKEESNRLKAENKKFNARLEELMNAACIQSEKIEEEITQINKKLNKVQDFQDRLSIIQEQLTLVKQDTFEVRDKLNWKSHHDLTPTSINRRKQGINPVKRLSGTDLDKWDLWLYSI